MREEAAHLPCGASLALVGVRPVRPVTFPEDRELLFASGRVDQDRPEPRRIATGRQHQSMRRDRSTGTQIRLEERIGFRGKQVEGPELAGKRVIVLEDTSTTGGSPLAAIEALERVGAIVAAVAVVVDRDTGAKERIESAGYPYFAALGLADLGLA